MASRRLPVQHCLGTFIVQTKNYPATNMPTIPTTLDYSYTVGDGTVVGSSDRNSPSDAIPPIQLTALTPEPASSTIVLLIGGSAALGGLIVRRRRRRLVAHGLTPNSPTSTP